MNRLYKIGISVALYCALSGCSQDMQYKTEPYFVPAEKDMTVYGLNGKGFRRNFIDKKRDRTLDEVIIVDRKGRKVLRPGDEGFEEQNEIFKEQVLPRYDEWPNKSGLINKYQNENIQQELERGLEKSSK